MADQRRGPITAAGKEVASKNATTHGATAKGFINEQEKERFETLLLDLRKHYKSENPLVKLQLERIARITVQLERIQNTIDASFEKSRAQSNLSENLMKSLNMTTDQRLAFLFDNVGVKENQMQYENTILKELIVFKLTLPKTSREFLELLPEVSRSLFDRAKNKNLSIKEYINKEIPKFNDPRSIKIEFVSPGVSNQIFAPSSLEDSILETDADDLLKAAKHILKEIQDREIEAVKVDDFKKLLPIEEQATTPDLERLDKLMRYQTTLQRQLSTSIGELLAINKNNF